MTRIAEAYSRARNTSNLKVAANTRMSSSDVLGAAGMAAQEEESAMILWSVVYGGKTSQKMRLVEGLANKLAGHMIRNQMKGSPRQISMEVIAYYLHAKCMACDGVGYQLIPHSIARSDNLCPECDGIGKPRPPSDPAFMWLLKYVETLISIAGGKQMQKLSLSMDL